MSIFVAQLIKVPYPLLGGQMKLNKKVEIGINAIGALKKRDGFATSKDLAPEVGTTISSLEQVMRNLRQGGIVTVKKGPGGGYCLNKDNEVTAYTVAIAVGRFGEVDASDQSASSQLRQSILQAYHNVKL